MGLTGKSRQRQFSSRAEGARLHPYSSSKTRGDSLPSGCFPYVAVLKTVGGHDITLLAEYPLMADRVFDAIADLEWDFRGVLGHA